MTQKIILRLAKIALMAVVTLYSLLIVFNNIFDYGSNFEFVKHVLAMDTTFPGNKGMWRSIDNTVAHHVAYILIIITEAVVALLAVTGTLTLWRTRKSGPEFNHAKGFSIAALTMGVILWFGGFIVIGGEWFLMWQSETWNGIQNAYRIASFFSLVLLFLIQEDE